MKRIKAKLIGSGNYYDPYKVNLPIYTIDCKRDQNNNPIYSNEYDGEKIDSVDYIKLECYVLIPNYLTEEYIKKNFPGWEEFKWDM